MQQLPLYGSTPVSGVLVFRLVVPGRLPSWNRVLAMEHWARYQFKKQLAEDFMSALRRSEADCSTKTTFARSSTSTYSAILESFLTIARARRKSKSAKGKRTRVRRSRSKSKFIPSGKPPF